MTAIRPLPDSLHPADGNALQLPYFSGSGFYDEIPLQRFLPPLSQGAVDYGLSQLVNAGDWIIDPFGASPQLAVEAAQNGRKALVVCNNPILQFYLEILCSAPAREDFLAALADFALERQENVRLETYLQSLYLAQCPRCGNLIQAQAFTWRKDPLQMRSRIIACEHCGNQGEFVVEAQDLERLNTSSLDALHRARALQRVNISPEVLKAAEEVSQVYTARALNFIFTFSNRIERMDTSPYHRKLLYAILIFLLDEGNSMWSWPVSKTRPKILSTPGQYREQNLWLLIDKAIDYWSSSARKIPFSEWPELPDGESGICLFRGRISGFRAGLADRPMRFAAACTAFPRPNQAFWSLTAVWSGWLWGRSAVLPMKSALERRRFDWAWYTAAVHQTLHSLQGLLGQAEPFLGFICEAEIPFLSSTLFAADNASFQPNGFAMRADEEIAQVLWKKSAPDRPAGHEELQKICADAMLHHLTIRNEPAEEIELAAACLTNLSRAGLLITREDPLPYGMVKDVQQQLSSLLNDKNQFTQFQQQHTSQEKRLYWLPGSMQPPYLTATDQAETAFQNLFSASSAAGLLEIDRILCREFSGVMTPSFSLVKALAAAYTQPGKAPTDQFHFNPELTKTHLEERFQAVSADLAALGEQLGYRAEPGSPFAWFVKQENDPSFLFYLIGNTVISPFTFADPPPATQVILYPDALMHLMQYKMDSNPALLEAARGKVKLIPFQKIADLRKKEPLQRSDFYSLLEGGFPGSQQPSQISFFPL